MVQEMWQGEATPQGTASLSTPPRQMGRKNDFKDRCCHSYRKPPGRGSLGIRHITSCRSSWSREVHFRMTNSDILPAPFCLPHKRQLAKPLTTGPKCHVPCAGLDCVPMPSGPELSQPQQLPGIPGPLQHFSSRKCIPAPSEPGAGVQKREVSIWPAWLEYWMACLVDNFPNR